jgi:alkylation response protein AidB-like acyl-CoA dehydrogenase
MSEFFQSVPALANQYQADRLLRAYIRAEVPAAFLAEGEKQLDRLGKRAAGDLFDLYNQAEREPPVHIPYDPWGRRIDDLRVSQAWDKLADAAAEEGIVATGYERKFGEYSRLVQFAKLYLYHPSSAFFSCPLAMTDGAARAIELYGSDEMKKNAFRRLTSRNPKEFWTSGQWMTERTGGSDVSGTATVAKHKGGDLYELHGTKWFTSATTSQMAMTLARIEGHPEGSRGLSLFYLELRDQNGQLKNIEVHRLKDKLGTKALPTAELSMRGTPALLVGGEGGGVKKIASLFNITRMYNSVCALGAARRALVLAAQYSEERVAFGKKIADQPLHAETLAELAVEFEGNFLLTFHLAQLLGKDETGKATPEESAMLRMLTPIAKLYTAKSSMAITSEVVECFGGAGYIEDVGIARLLRDAQVFSIWEGTTNVLSLDVLRAIERENAFPPFVSGILKRVEKVSGFDDEVNGIRHACQELRQYLGVALKEGPDFVQAGARQLAFSLARTFAASLLVEFAARTQDRRSAEAARRWCHRGLSSLMRADSGRRNASRDLLRGLEGA